MLKPLNHIVFNCYPNLWYNSYHVNELVEVKHEKKSLDYQPLRYVNNQHEAISHLMMMSAKVL